jgi:hypothetical protein
MMFRRLQKQLQDTELGTGSGTTGTRTCTYVQVQWGYNGFNHAMLIHVVVEVLVSCELNAKKLFFSHIISMIVEGRDECSCILIC